MRPARQDGERESQPHLHYPFLILFLPILRKKRIPHECAAEDRPQRGLRHLCSRITDATKRGVGRIRLESVHRQAVSLKNYCL